MSKSDVARETEALEEAIRKIEPTAARSPAGLAALGATGAKPKAPPAQEAAPAVAANRGPLERDNIGTRYESQDGVQAFWLPYTFNRPKFPYIFYDIREKNDAMAAMLALPPIKTAADTGKLVSTEVLQFGVYPQTANDRIVSWGFFLAGEHITPALYDAAIASCEKYNGTNPRVSDPPKPAAGRPVPPKSNLASVTFDREEKIDLLQQMKARGITFHGEVPSAQFATKRYFKAPNKDAALAYLKTAVVDKQFYYLLVDTPDGVFGRDIDGIYEQPN